MRLLIAVVALGTELEHLWMKREREAGAGARDLGMQDCRATVTSGQVTPEYSLGSCSIMDFKRSSTVVQEKGGSCTGR